MRRSQQDAIANVGVDVHAEMVRVFDRSSFRRSAFVDGKLVAMGGVVGSMLAPHGFVWLALAEDFSARHRIAVAREAKRWTGRLTETRTALTALCLLEDAPSWRFLQFLGFEPEPQSSESARAMLIYRRR
jgi:hypothetical protein